MEADCFVIITEDGKLLVALIEFKTVKQQKNNIQEVLVFEKSRNEIRK